MKIKKGDRVLLVGKKNYLITAEKRQFSTEYGNFDLGKLIGKNYGVKISTHLGKEYHAIEPRVPDLQRKIKRMPQVIMKKDAGVIASYTGLNKEDLVVEAGTGSGMLTIFLAGIVKKVVSYEKREEFQKVAKGNLEKCGIKNVTLKLRDVEKGIKEKNVDVVILDLGAPEQVIQHARKALTPGGFLVVYSPVVEQITRIRDIMEGFGDIETVEIMKREWDVGGNKTRPKTRMLGHTAFLTFARKL